MGILPSISPLGLGSVYEMYLRLQPPGLIPGYNVMITNSDGMTEVTVGHDHCMFIGYPYTLVALPGH